MIDVFRLALRNDINNQIISTRDNGSIINKLKSYLTDTKMQNNVVVTLRTLCNFYCHSSGEELIFKNRVELLETVIGISLQNKNIEVIMHLLDDTLKILVFFFYYHFQVGLATFLMNTTVVCQKKQDEIGLFLLANILPDIITVLTDAEAQFRSIIALGTLVSCGSQTEKQQMKKRVLENVKFVEKLKILSHVGESDVELKRKTCAQELEYELKH